MSPINPRTLYTWATRTLVVTAPLLPALMIVWATKVAGVTAAPVLFLMAYMLVLLVAAGAGCVAVLAGCQMAVHKAFSVGYQVGQLEGEPVPAEPSRRFRLVE